MVRDILSLVLIAATSLGASAADPDQVKFSTNPCTLRPDRCAGNRNAGNRKPDSLSAAKLMYANPHMLLT